ncbi:hypothetical protein ACWIUA_01620 [Ursidibacter sp. B-7004-1]
MNRMMSNDLVLRRNIHIETWRVQGTVLKAQERADILMILQYVAENENATAKGMARRLLFEENARLVVAERLLKMTEMLGLVKQIQEDRHKLYALTEKGELALQEQEVFIPEDGFWEISFTNEPLLSHTILDFKPFKEPDAYQEVKNKVGLEERKQNIKPMPDWIRNPNFNAVKPFLNQKQSIWLENIQPKGEKVSSNLKLILEWNVSKQSIRLLKNNQVVHQFTYKKYDQNQIWQILLEQNGWQDDWSWAENSMAMSFEETDEKSRQTMHTDLAFRRPKIGDLGEFNDFTAENVAIHAIDLNNATDWARWRLEHNINDFADEQTYQKWVEQAKSPFAEYDCSLPKRDELANRFWQDDKYSQKSWYLMAASDWQI